MYELPTLAREAGKLKMLPRRRTHARGAVLPSLLPSCPSLAWAKKLR